MTTTGRKIYPPVYFVLAALVMWGLHRFLPVASWGTGGTGVAAYLLIGLGALVTLGGIFQFGKAGTTVKPFRASSSLVSGGLYRISRNPMYLGMALLLVGGFLRMGSVSPILGVAAFILVITKRVIVIEEEMLEERFGEAYRQYKARVRRWI